MLEAFGEEPPPPPLMSPTISSTITIPTIPTSAMYPREGPAPLGPRGTRTLCGLATIGSGGSLGRS